MASDDFDAEPEEGVDVTSEDDAGLLDDLEELEDDDGYESSEEDTTDEL